MTDPLELRWLRTKVGPRHRKAHLYPEGFRVSLCRRMTLERGTELEEVRGGCIPRQRCSLCWSASYGLPGSIARRKGS